MDVPRCQLLQIVSFAFGSTFTLDRLAAQTATQPATSDSSFPCRRVCQGSAGETKME